MEKLIKEFKGLLKEVETLKAKDIEAEAENRGSAYMLDYVIGRIEEENKK